MAQRIPMPQRTTPTAAEIAENQMPGWKAVKPAGPVREFGGPSERAAADSTDDASAKADAVLPDTDKLLRKYLGADAGPAALSTDSTDTPASDVELVDLKSGDLERTVGVNLKSQKIEWSQG